MTADTLVRTWKDPALRVDDFHPSGTGLAEISDDDLRGAERSFAVGSSGWVCSLTDECPNSVLVCC